MSAAHERAHASRLTTDNRAYRRASNPRSRPPLPEEAMAVQRRDYLIHRQQFKLTQWKDTARRIIKEISDASDESLGDVGPSELARVVEYIKIMKSSVYIVQTINEALKERVDELALQRERDGQVLHNLMAYVQSLPRLHTVRDERTNEQMFQVDLDPTRNIQVCAVDQEATSSEAEREVTTRRRIKWIRHALSAALCVVIGASVVKSGFGKNRNEI